MFSKKLDILMSVWTKSCEFIQRRLSSIKHNLSCYEEIYLYHKCQVFGFKWLTTYYGTWFVGVKSFHLKSESFLVQYVLRWLKKKAVRWALKIP